MLVCVSSFSSPGAASIVELFNWSIVDIQFSWLLLCLDLDDEQLSNELLRHVVELWMTIRGFSMANAWMEYFKQMKETTTKKKQGLRKGLKRKRLQLDEEDNIDELL